MREAYQLKNIVILILSVVGLYNLAPSLDTGKGIWISLAFALIIILSTKPRFDVRHLRIYGLYIAIDMVTYFILYNDQPWDFIFHGGLWDSTPIPLIGCSIIMAFAGWLLLPEMKDRIIYTVITLGLQSPISIFIGTEFLQSTFNDVAHALGYVEYYSGAWQIWQFEWMLTYYLPVYFLHHKQKV